MAITRKMTTPVNVPKTRRNHRLRNLTSMPAGKIVPIAVIPLLREDNARVNLQMAFEMQETVEVLLNGVNIDVHAYLVPNLADPRFLSMDDLNRSYMGEARPGQPVVPFIEKQVAGAYGTNEIHDRLGKHAKPTDQVNMAYVKAYNLMVNHRRQEISPKLEQRDLFDKTLAQAFWSRNMFDFIVPDWDQAAMEGKVGMNIANQLLPLKGPLASSPTNVPNKGTPVAGNPAFYKQFQTTPRSLIINSDGTVVSGPAGDTSAVVAHMDGLVADLNNVYAELGSQNAFVTLSDLEMARKLQSYALIRKRYNALPEEFVIDMLMSGMQVPEQGWKQPIPLGHKQVQFGMAKRYASDGGSLTESVVNGAAALDFSFVVPQCPPGGVIIVTAEISPEQLFERQEDPYLHASGTEDFPDWFRDELDPEKVEIVPNRFIDIDHDEPDDVYGYAPLNYRWNNAGPGIGGRFIRPEVDAGFDEDRQAIWAVETQNPTLSEDAYLVPADIHLKPFVTSLIDPFDCMTVGNAVITGNTVFGAMLIEANDGSDYDKLLDKVPVERIEK